MRFQNKSKPSSIFEDVATWMANTLSSIADGVIATNVQGRIVFMNNVAENLTGFELKNSPGPFASEILTLRPGSITQEVNFCPLREAFLQKRTLRSESPYLLLGQNGMASTIHFTSSPIQNTDGESIGAVIVVRPCAPDLENNS
jgi:diguanylate cyclase